MKSKIFFIVFVTCMVVALAVYNVNLGLRIDKLSNFALANVEALAQNEGGDGDGWTELETTLTEKTNGTLSYERVTVLCAEGGPMSSCTESCKYRHYYNGAWGDWVNC